MKKLSMLGLLFIFGCQPHHQPVQVTVLVDISASIGGSDSRIAKATEALANKLVGGDEITILPICDAAYSGQSFHFNVDEKREAFNQEIERFRSQVRSSIRTMTSGPVCKKTAILDTLDRALATPGDIYIFTDGIEDSEISFYLDPRLASPERAESLAKAIARPMSIKKVRLGLIDSADFDRLSRQREDAIVKFWKTYLAELSRDSQVESPELLR